ncbi:MAG: FAD-binding oxidoreductase [Acidisphaera sp.]|nr:FAD-binding oxidoreductase [Acidisphaera sp.]
MLAADWRPQPFWWEDAPPEPADADLPARTDVAVIGGGYCGLMAALALAQNGIQALVLDAEDPGAGAATRNHGHVGGIGKLPANLERRVGAERAAIIKDDAVRAWNYLRDLIRDEGLDVDYVQRGRFLGAHSRAAYDALVRQAEDQRRSLRMTIHAVPREEQRREIGSDFYFGGTVTEEAGALHPAKLHREIRRLAERAGALIRGKARVMTITRIPGGYRLGTARGVVDADQVVVATNGYTGALTPDIRRRLVPVSAYMMATEEMPPDLAAACMPTNRTGGDTKRAIYAYRLSPDGRRIIFAGRAKWHAADDRLAAPILHAHLCRVWPELREIRVSHSWKGQIAFTFDHLPHMGSQDGLHFVAGCNSSGVVRMSYLGRQIGLKIAGRQDRPCGFEDLKFPTLPTYRGTPWFLPIVGRYYNLRDQLDRTLSGRWG